MTAQELKATSVLWMDIEEASVKTRDAPPGDPEDQDHAVWAGVLPTTTTMGAAQPASGPHQDLPLPPELAELIASGHLR